MNDPVAKVDGALELNTLTNLDPLNTRKGSWKIASVRGVPVFLHWTLGAAVLPVALLTGFELTASLYYFLAYVFLILIHELGHITAALALKMRIHALHLGLFDGHCVIQRPRGTPHTFIVFSAGFAAQALLLVFTILCVHAIGPPSNPFWLCVFNTFTVANVFVMVVNLIPFTVANGVLSDGGILWGLFLHKFRGHPHPFPDLYGPSTVFSPDTSLVSVSSMVPKGFTTGIEILNDNTTPMEFVVAMLIKYMFLERERAIQMMLRVHESGGLLWPIDGVEAAQAIAAAITADARAAGHQLVCRMVDVARSPISAF